MVTHMSDKEFIPRISHTQVRKRKATRFKNKQKDDSRFLVLPGRSSESSLRPTTGKRLNNLKPTPLLRPVPAGEATGQTLTPSWRRAVHPHRESTTYRRESSRTPAPGREACAVTDSAGGARGPFCAVPGTHVDPSVRW